ncbi:MAG: sensor histidine kinase [Actinomycetota bacterium]
MSLGLPEWMYAGASATALAVVAITLIFDGGRLPLFAQLPLAAVALVPWVPGLHMRSLSIAYVVVTVGPIAALTLTDAHPILFGLLALATARLAVFGPISAGAGFAAAAIGLVVLRAVTLDAVNWFVWKSYIELALVLGWAQRGQRQLVLRAESLLEHERNAAVQERRRIARDVHDTLAHSLTVMMVHLNSARLELQHDPARAANALEELAALGRASLEEVRRSVGLLADTSTTVEPTDPTSAAAAFEELVASFRRVGADVDFQLDVGMVHVGLLANAPARLWGSAWRIAQESLANAVKHAPGAPIVITVDIDDGGLRLQVTNPLPDHAIALDVPSGGHGIEGMRERAALLNGAVEAGAEENRWNVRAHLPLSPNATEARQTSALGSVS